MDAAISKFRKQDLNALKKKWQLQTVITGLDTTQQEAFAAVRAELRGECEDLASRCGPTTASGVALPASGSSGAHALLGAAQVRGNSSLNYLPAAAAVVGVGLVGFAAWHSLAPVASPSATPSASPSAAPSASPSASPSATPSATPPVAAAAQPLPAAAGASAPAASAGAASSTARAERLVASPAPAAAQLASALPAAATQAAAPSTPQAEEVLPDWRRPENFGLMAACSVGTVVAAAGLWWLLRPRHGGDDNDVGVGIHASGTTHGSTGSAGDDSDDSIGADAMAAAMAAGAVKWLSPSPAAAAQEAVGGAAPWGSPR